jgi:hypothetical protein
MQCEHGISKRHQEIKKIKGDDDTDRTIEEDK